MILYVINLFPSKSAQQICELLKDPSGNTYLACIHIDHISSDVLLIWYKYKQEMLCQYRSCSKFMFVRKTHY